MQGESYSNVVEMEVPKSTYVDNDITLYWADSIGIIKKTIIMDNNTLQNWELIRYNTKLIEVE